MFIIIRDKQGRTEFYTGIAFPSIRNFGHTAAQPPGQYLAIQTEFQGADMLIEIPMADVQEVLAALAASDTMKENKALAKLTVGFNTQIQ